jgi:hypothetical protein
MQRNSFSMLLLVALAGCATVPPMDVGYYLPKGAVAFRAVESVSCDGGNHILGAVTGTITPAYSADGVRRVVSIGRLDGFLSDTDIGFEFTDDGRLKGMNSESAGQAEAVIKTAASLFSTLIMAMDGNGQQEFPDECAKIAKWGGEKKVLTLTYTGDTDFAGRDGSLVPLRPEQNSFFYASAMPNIGSVCARIGPSVAPPALNVPASTASGNVRLPLVQPAATLVEIIKFANAGCSGAILSKVASMTIQVPQHGTAYDLLLPKAAMFGKNGITLNLSDAGTVTKLKYGKTSGAPALANALSTAANAVVETRAEKIARMKEEADLIIQQERLVKCIAKSDECK